MGATYSSHYTFFHGLASIESVSYIKRYYHSKTENYIHLTHKSHHCINLKLTAIIIDIVLVQEVKISQHAINIYTF